MLFAQSYSNRSMHTSNKITEFVILIAINPNPFLSSPLTKLPCHNDNDNEISFIKTQVSTSLLATLL